MPLVMGSPGGVDLDDAPQLVVTGDPDVAAIPSVSAMQAETEL
jgi:hypothetical protein